MQKKKMKKKWMISLKNSQNNKNKIVSSMIKNMKLNLKKLHKNQLKKKETDVYKKKQIKKKKNLKNRSLKAQMKLQIQ